MNAETVMGFVRHLLTFGGGFLVTKGYLDSAGLETVVGSLVALIGVAWSAWVKRPAA